MPFVWGISNAVHAKDSGEQLLMNNSWLVFEDTVVRLSFTTISITSQCGDENIHPFTVASVSLLPTWRIVPKFVLAINLAEMFPTWPIVPNLVLAMQRSTLKKTVYQSINQSINQELTKWLFDILTTFV